MTCYLICFVDSSLYNKHQWTFTKCYDARAKICTAVICVLFPLAHM